MASGPNVARPASCSREHEPLGVYIHIPFCRTRCPYCDFVSNAIPGPIPGTFVDAVCREVESFEGPREAATIFFGGGTPSLLEPVAIEHILETVHERFAVRDPEITIEANPDDVTIELADAWSALGVNRVSLGVQSFDDRVLRYLGRRHDATAARRACTIVADRFENWAMDLIFGAHPIDAWQSTLEQCVGFRPKHVSAYGLTYEAGTAFAPRRHEAIDDDAWLALYRQAETALAGYEHYEISNFALPGYACRHNLVYWHNGEYAGFGPAAYSFLNGVRGRDLAGLDDYLANPGAKAERLQLTDREIRLETVIQHLRLKAGLLCDTYHARFGRSFLDDFHAPLRALIKRGLLEEFPDSIRPTAKGFELNNEIGLALVDAQITP